MARPIEYDKEAVLSSAMKLFWEKGYESTSMKDLVNATGLTTRSMYNIFESKNGLFKASLDWYYEIGARSRYEQLIREDGLMAIRHFFDMLANRKSNNGCLYVNTASDRHNIDDQSIMIVDKYFDGLEDIFKAKLKHAAKYENYDGNPDVVARQLIVVIEGLSVYSKNLDDVGDNSKIVYGFLELFNI